MNLRPLSIVLPLALLGGCVAPIGPVEVTRFHVPELAPMARGSIAVEPAAGMDGGSLELQAYQGAVAQELRRTGFAVQDKGGDQIAEVRLSRQTYRPDRNRNPVSVGVGGSTGSYGSGLGVGIGLDLSGPPPEMVETRLAVAIRDRKSGKVVWEGRAQFTVRASAPLAQTTLAAPKMAAALFQGFPGNSGETILVR